MWCKFAIALLSLAVALVAAAPTRPNIAEVFLSVVDVESHDRDHVIFGEGFLAHNQPAQMGAERYDLHPSQYHVIHVLDLQRGDLHKEYQLNSEDPTQCRSNTLNAVVPPFAWVANSTYVGAVKEREVVLDGWEARFGGVRLLVGVSQTDVNRPVILERESSGELTRYFFREFNMTTPPAKYFNVPSECNHEA